MKRFTMKRKLLYAFPALLVGFVLVSYSQEKSSSWESQQFRRQGSIRKAIEIKPAATGSVAKKDSNEPSAAICLVQKEEYHYMGKQYR